MKEILFDVRKSLIASLMLLLPATGAWAGENLHGHSLVGPLKYPPDFAHFDYVNPDAPKGGEVNRAVRGNFDSFNPMIPEGVTARGISVRAASLLFDSLMVSSADEVSSQYGLIAESMTYPEDFSWVSFKLREEARWHDGKPISVEDVIYSFEKSVELNPERTFYYKDVTGAEKIGEREVKFNFGVTGNRELPHILGQIVVIPKHFWEGKNAEGEDRDISRITLEPLLGSGPYKIDSFVEGRSITYTRVEDYWAKDLNVRIGQNNFDRLTYRFYFDEDAVFDAFKVGTSDWRSESTAKRWATEYTFPAVEEGKVIMETFDTSGASGIMLGFLMNLRRDKFQDIRVRKALARVFNFEAANQALFYNQYVRPNSYFFPTELSSTGLPEGEELAILEEVRDQVPASVFTEPFENPVFEGRRDDRKARREALALLKEAGWTIQDGKLTNEKGEAFEIEYLIYNASFERVGLFYKEMITPLGIDFSVRLVDPSQYLERVNRRDYDIIYTGWGQSLSPGNEQLEYWGSEAADRAGSSNYLGIQDPAIDHLIQKVILAEDREALIHATRALDRVLLHHHFLVPGWTLQKDRRARWDRFGRPKILPKYSVGFPTVWWFDEAKAARVAD